MEKKYNIVLSGELVDGVNQETAISAFAMLFKVDIAKAESIFNKAPIAVKKNVAEQNAQKYIHAIKKAGLCADLKLVIENGTETHNAETSNVAANKLEQENTEARGNTAEEEPPESLHPDSITPTTINPIVDPEKYLGFPYSIEGKPDYSFLSVRIPKGQTLKVEASGMATMDTHISMKTKVKGGLGRFLTGENIFINEFNAENAEGEIGIAPATPGDIAHQYLDGDTIYLQNSAFVAATMGVNVESKWQGMVKGFFSGEKLFLIRCSGVGDLWFNTYGAMIEIDVSEDYVVDTGNIVAFTEGLEYKITKVGGYKSLFFSGEGFVCRFSGKGKVWIQTRSAASFAAWAQYFRPAKS